MRLLRIGARKSASATGSSWASWASSSSSHPWFGWYCGCEAGRSDFAFHYSGGTTFIGIGLAAITLVAGCLFEWLVGRVPGVANAQVLVALAVSIVNPLFEELLVLAYVIQSMRRRFGLTAAMHASIAVRLVYHLYQGPMVVMGFEC
jgi:membrane protease YdiL (CAAX protease family)